MVLGRLADGRVFSSSSEFDSGAARFLPLGSRTGSLIVKEEEAEGATLRRDLFEITGYESDIAVRNWRINGPFTGTGEILF